MCVTGHHVLVVVTRGGGLGWGGYRTWGGNPTLTSLFNPPITKACFSALLDSEPCCTLPLPPGPKTCCLQFPYSCFKCCFTPRGGWGVIEQERGRHRGHKGAVLSGGNKGAITQEMEERRKEERKEERFREGVWVETKEKAPSGISWPAAPSGTRHERHFYSGWREQWRTVKNNWRRTKTVKSRNTNVKKQNKQKTRRGGIKELQ